MMVAVSSPPVQPAANRGAIGAHLVAALPQLHSNDRHGAMQVQQVVTHQPGCGLQIELRALAQGRLQSCVPKVQSMETS
jgi:hypothetical protein